MDDTKDIALFDRTRLRLVRKRASGDGNFLREWAGKQINERLGDITRDFPLGLQIGSADTTRYDKVRSLLRMDITEGVNDTSFIADEEFLPIKEKSLDIALSNLALHSVNDLPGALIQIRRALKDDGLFVAAMLGGETLRELRTSLMHAEMSLRDGASPRVFPFADKPQMGGLLQRAGFALPVVDSDILSVSYENMFALIRDLRAMGESNIISARDKRYTGRDFFMEAARYYQEHFPDQDGRITASFEIIFLIGWAPHASQQKPLKPGSADMRLADALETTEFKA